MSWNSGGMGSFSGLTVAEAEALEEEDDLKEYFTPDNIAQRFHEAYERLAPQYTGPEDSHRLMMAVVRSLLDDGVIIPGMVPGA